MIRLSDNARWWVRTVLLAMAVASAGWGIVDDLRYDRLIYADGQRRTRKVEALLAHFGVPDPTTRP